MSSDQVRTVHKLRTHKVRHEEIDEDTKFIHKQEREMLQIAIGFRMNDDISVDTIFHTSIHGILCYLQKY